MQIEMELARCRGLGQGLAPGGIPAGGLEDLRAHLEVAPADARSQGPDEILGMSSLGDEQGDAPAQDPRHGSSPARVQGGHPGAAAKARQQHGHAIGHAYADGHSWLSGPEPVPRLDSPCRGMDLASVDLAETHGRQAFGAIQARREAPVEGKGGRDGGDEHRPTWATSGRAG